MFERCGCPRPASPAGRRSRSSPASAVSAEWAACRCATRAKILCTEKKEWSPECRIHRATRIRPWGCGSWGEAAACPSDPGVACGSGAARSIIPATAVSVARGSARILWLWGNFAPHNHSGGICVSRTTLFQLRSDGRHVLDGSTLGVAIQSLRNVTILQGGHGLRLDQGGTVELAKNPRLANMQSFT